MKSLSKKKVCRCETIKGIGKAHTFNCVFGKKKVVKHWAVLNENGTIVGNQSRGPLKCSIVFAERKNAHLFTAMFYGFEVVPCEIHYTLPKKRRAV